MTQKPHTPGPWMIDWDRGPAIDVVRLDRADLIHIAIVRASFISGGPTRSEGEANARLIAAAPNLLHALEGLLQGIDALAASGVDTSPFIGVGEALAAVQLAKGR